MDITSPIKAARVKKGLTQAQVASGLGVTKSAVSAWELRRAAPEATRLSDLERLLHPHFNVSRYLRWWADTPSKVAA